MGKLVILCYGKSLKYTQGLHYAVSDSHYSGLRELEGKLHWILFDPSLFGSENAPKFLIERYGDMVQEPVTPEESETITGMVFPASMDRLRELVHWAGEQSKDVILTPDTFSETRKP